MIKIISLILCTCLFACSSLDEDKINNEISALSHYPNCSYEILDIIKVRSGKTVSDVYYKTTSPLGLRISRAQGDKNEAILALKSEAYRIGADAIAVTEFNNDTKLISTHRSEQAVVLNNYYYTAQAIKLCKEPQHESITEIKRKPVPYLIDGTENL